MTAMLVARLAGAAAPDPELAVTVTGARCEGASLEESVEALLGPEPRAGSWRIHERLRQDEEGWVLELEIRGPAGESRRRLHAPRCETVIEAGALVLALAIDPTLARRAAVPERVGAGETEGAAPLGPGPQAAPPAVSLRGHEDALPGSEVPLEEPSEPTEAEEQAKGRARETEAAAAPASRAGATGFAVRFEGGIDGPALGGVGGEVGGALGVLRPRLRVDLTARGRLPRRFQARARPEVGGELAAWRVGLRGCGRLARGLARLDLAVCGGFEGGGVLAEGVGLAEVRRTHVPWLALLGAGQVGYVPHPRVMLGLVVEAGAALVRPHLRVEGLGRVFRVGPAFGRVFGAVEVRFGGG